MQILTLDIGTGTQDILLYDSAFELENCYKLVLPSPTLRIAQRLRAATRARRPVALSGVTMGGGPCQWAAHDHVRAGLPLYATADAARTFNDELDVVEREMGIRVLSHDELAALPAETEHLTLQDFDFAAIAQACAAFGVTLAPDGIAVAVFDHGNAPPGYSDRQFRFDFLQASLHDTRKLSTADQLGAFAYPAPDVPVAMTRLAALTRSIGFDPARVVVMDTAPAAVLGALCDPAVARLEHALVVNAGNFHTLAFRLGPAGIAGLFEHHTGELTLPQLDGFLTDLAAGTLTHAAIFDSMGHGALVLDHTPLDLNAPHTGVAVVGPRRSLLNASRHSPYFAVPFGDMMLAGCYGLLRAYAHHIPAAREPILASLAGTAKGAPWG